MGALITFIGGIVVKFFSNSVVKYLALKALLLSLFTVILPVVLFKVWLKIQVWVMDFLAENISSLTGGAIAEPAVVEFTGLAAWLADLLKLPQCASVLLSCAVVSFSLKFIKR